jgi:hypothetical protein
MRAFAVALFCLVPGLAAGQELALTNVRNTYGELGGTRPDTKFLPGDVVYIAFDIENISVAADGGCKYSMGMSVNDKAGKPTLAQAPADREDIIPLGGNKLPARAYVTLGLDMPPGEYTVSVDVTDKNKPGAKKTLTRKFEVLKKDFGIVAVITTADIGGQVMVPTTGVVGQSIWVQFGIVGFARDPKTKQPNIECEIVFLDDKGQPTVKKPKTDTLNSGVEEAAEGFASKFMVPFTRAGKFVARIKATDKVANKSYTFDLPVAAVPPATDVK